MYVCLLRHLWEDASPQQHVQRDNGGSGTASVADQYPSLRLATAALLPDGEGLRAVSTYASGLQCALVMLARHHGFRGYNQTDLADDMMSRLMEVADQLGAD